MRDQIMAHHPVARVTMRDGRTVTAQLCTVGGYLAARTIGGEVLPGHGMARVEVTR